MLDPERNMKKRRHKSSFRAGGCVMHTTPLTTGEQGLDEFFSRGFHSLGIHTSTNTWVISTCTCMGKRI